MVRRGGHPWAIPCTGGSNVVVIGVPVQSRSSRSRLTAFASRRTCQRPAASGGSTPSEPGAGSASPPVPWTRAPRCDRDSTRRPHRRPRGPPPGAHRLLLPHARLGLRGRGRRAGDDGPGLAEASTRFEGRSALRSWLYRIATNVCLDMLRAASAGPGRWTWARRPPPTRRCRAALPEDRWISARSPTTGSCPPTATRPRWPRPASRSAWPSSPPSSTCRPAQRAVLILREVLRWQATEVAELLDTTRGLGQQRPPAGPGHAGRHRPRRRRAARRSTPSSEALLDPLRRRLRALRHRRARRAAPRGRHVHRCRRSTSGCRAPTTSARWFIGPGRRLRGLPPDRPPPPTAARRSPPTSRPVRAAGSRSASR